LSGASHFYNLADLAGEPRFRNAYNFTGKNLQTFNQSLRRGNCLVPEEYPLKLT
jgi:hypothetical protein